MEISIKKFLLTVLMAVFFISTHSKAVVADTQQIFPSDFMYQGKPIDPLCLESNGTFGQSNLVNLGQCSKHPTYKVEKITKELIDKGYVGFDYSLEENGDTIHGSSYYKILGKYQDNFVLFQNDSSGGSGFFTAITLVKRDGDSVQLVKKIAEGDRCNNGIVDVELKDNLLKFEQYITPYDMLLLSEILSENVQAYDDLAACAACCIGRALFEHDFETQKLISVTLEKLGEKDSELEQGIYQACLNKLLREYRSKNKLTFTPNELKVLTEKFNKVCVAG